MTSPAPGMTLGIDAANIRHGGGVTHLVELLRAAAPSRSGFSNVIVWGGKDTLSRIDERQWLRKRHHGLLDRPLPYRAFFQRFLLSGMARASNCDVLFIPGGSFAGDFRPRVALSQNLLPFEPTELKRFGRSRMTLKLLALRGVQGRTFRRADGVIFLTRYAREVVLRAIGSTAGRTTIIPHGIDKRFFHRPRPQRPITSYSTRSPLRILYVSAVDMYKHQWNVVEAIAELRSAGLPVRLDMVGPAYAPALERLRRAMERADRAGQFISYSGAVSHQDLHLRYEQAELCIFASSCENLPNILLEGMASGLPIASSDCGPMPEVLGEAGVYFNPLDASDISRALRRLIEAPDLRVTVAQAAMDRASAFSWEQCADKTFGFLRDVAGQGRHARES